MTQPILPQEVLDTKKNLNDKSPGTDGFPGQFYKCLHRLCKYLTVVWGLKPLLVLHKEGKYQILCEGYRPVSLLYNDLNSHKHNGKKNAEI